MLTLALGQETGAIRIWQWSRWSPDQRAHIRDL